MDDNIADSAPSSSSDSKPDDVDDAVGQSSTDPNDSLLSETDFSSLLAKIADNIRETIESYFATTNLQWDRRLLDLIGGSQNLPVPISEIQSFEHMKRFHSIPLIVDALRESQIVSVVEIANIWHVQRSNALEVDDRNLPKTKKQNKKKKYKTHVLPETISIKTSSKKKASGFEEFYAEVPVTAAVFEEEQQIYNPLNAIPTRLETAIQRYSRRRTFRPEHLKIFDSWMSFGGIRTGPKQFTGVDNSMLRDMTAREIAELTAVHFVSDDAADRSKMVLDFKSVISAWLSCVAPDHWDLHDPATLARCIDVPRNFYNYLLHHEAVSEHRSDIIAARAVCDQAKIEIPCVQSATALLPGQFNSACLQVFAEQGQSPSEFATELETPNGDESSSAALLLMTAFSALDVHSIVELPSDLIINTLTLVGHNIYLEIISVDKPNDNHNNHLQPLGKLVCRACWPKVSFASWDLPPHVRGSTLDPSVQIKASADHRLFTFLLEPDLLTRCCLPGMMLQADVWTMATRWQLLGAVRHALPSYHAVIPNELHLNKHWREPKVIPREEHEARAAWLAGRGVRAEKPDSAVATDGDDATADKNEGEDKEEEEKKE